MARDDCTKAKRLIRVCNETVSEDFIGIYLKVSDDKRQTYYAERMEEFCKEVIVLEGKTVLDDMQEALKGKFISNIYLAS